MRCPVVSGSPNCTIETAGDAVGILSGYSATTGYDLATGLGSVNVNNLVNAWVSTSNVRRVAQSAEFWLAVGQHHKHGAVRDAEQPPELGCVHHRHYGIGKLV